PGFGRISGPHPGQHHPVRQRRRACSCRTAGQADGTLIYGKERFMTAQDPHNKRADQLIRELETHLENGLSEQQARERLQKYGPNELQEKPRPGFLAMLFAQFNNFLVILLIIAAIISLLLGEYVDATAIIVIVALNAVVGVIQESKA